MDKTFRRTKIVCTLGPAVYERGLMREIILAGMDVARFNFSHGTREDHVKHLQELMALREELNVPVAALFDTKGPEIRIGRFTNKSVMLKAGQTFTLTTNPCDGDENRVFITYADLPKDVSVGTSILIDDGLVALKTERVTETDIVCSVLNGGVISDQKGVNVPGARLSMPFISERDREDIIYGVQNGFDFIAASFTRTAADILQIRELLSEAGCPHVKVIAKIENAQGVENIDDIIRVSDGIMVARGDMGVEIPLEDVPVLQKLIIRKVYNAGKQVITATQMLDSMIKNPRPTRAETTDVANAIYDGTSAIMLSGETAAGLYPIESVKTMARIALRTEADIDYVGRFKKREAEENPDVTGAISHSTCTSAHDLKAAAIITVTKSGKTARMISKYRPNCPIITCTTSETIRRQLNLSWGVIPLMIKEEKNTDELFEHAVQAGVKAGYLRDGELVVMTAGVPLGISGTTNMMKVHVVGHILVTGKGVTEKRVCADLCVVSDNTSEATKRFKDGDILVARQTDNSMMPMIRRAGGIIVEDTDPNGHAAIAGMSLNIPAIIGAENAVKILKSGAVVTLDAQRGMVSCDAENSVG
ncbi:MAG: pyruvate kinase [Eubacteriales bacterium]|nr:pyruvate kinase [Eubacteriales bacterium]MDD3882355.1 pyruvate kinase [Eubacteriales bacterium]MDD4512424.1 pyruvate kinase [Eubacteriales bacterium]